MGIERPLNGWVFKDADDQPLYLGDIAIVIKPNKGKLIVGGKVTVEAGFKGVDSACAAWYGLAGEGIEASQLAMGALTLDGRALYSLRPKRQIEEIRLHHSQPCAECDNSASSGDYLCADCREAR